MTLLLSLLGCATPHVDLWTSTREVCGFEDGETLPWTWDDRGGLVAGASGAPPFTGACAEALLADLGADPDEVAEEFGVELAPGRGFPTWILAAEEDDRINGLAVAFNGLYFLLGGDFGDTWDLDADPYLSQTYTDAMRDAADELGLSADSGSGAQVLYDFVVNRISGLKMTDKSAVMAVYRPSGSLRMASWYSTSTPTDMAVTLPSNVAAVLVHEAHHIDDHGHRHNRCKAPAISTDHDCDPDFTESYGFGISALSVAIAQVEALDEPGWDYYDRLDWHRQLSWLNHIMAPLPVPKREDIE